VTNPEQIAVPARWMHASSYDVGPPVADIAANGCGSNDWIGKHVPDKVRGVFNFTRACNGHDACYEHQRGKSFCDNGFLKAMNRRCAKDFPDLRQALQHGACRAVAGYYWGAVVVFGAGPYKAAGKK
jgi:Group XII secretory phospholipase A2 precursor (PLA2G12)